jgi:uncharacterized short protein YbdD (DUF466 family)
VRERIRRLWAGIRRLSGDDAYERYLRHHAIAHPHEPVMDRGAFFRSEQERRWGGVTRCC